VSDHGKRRIVVTGVGLVSPLGVGTEPTWQGIVEGRSGVGPITRFDVSDYACRIAAEVDGFNPTDYSERKEVKKFDLFAHYGVAAAQMALEDSGLLDSEFDPDRVGAMVGAGMGGLPLIERTHELLLKRGPSRISPFFIPGIIINMVSGQLSIRYGFRGPNSATVTACTSGLHAVGDAFRQIQWGYADAMVAGGAEGILGPLAVGGFTSMKALSLRNDEPDKASRPWDSDRDGFVIGEGAGIVILEERRRALERGAPIYAELVGYGMSADAYHISAPHPEGAGAELVMNNALADAGIAADEIDYINAHGTSTPLGDLAEVQAIKKVFGEHAYKLAVSSTKSSTGHLLGAAGGLEAGILALALRHQTLPPTLNLDHPGEGCDLDFVPHQARLAEVRYALTNSFGFGGTNGALIMAAAGSA
jgi:3-oxoacyl-[acyl-carrier-protein] synthase II